MVKLILAYEGGGFFLLLINTNTHYVKDLLERHHACVCVCGCVRMCVGRKTEPSKRAVVFRDTGSSLKTIPSAKRNSVNILHWQQKASPPRARTQTEMDISTIRRRSDKVVNNERSRKGGGVAINIHKKHIIYTSL